MSDESTSFVDQVGRGLGGIFKFFIRLLFVLVLAIALGGGIFYGISVGLPALDRAYIQPVRDNTAAISVLQTRATQTADQYAAQIETLQTRITELEVQNDNDQESMALIETQLGTLTPLLASQSEMVARLDELDATLAAIDAAILAAETKTDEDIAALQEGLAGNTTTLETVTTALENEPYPGETLHAELQLVKIMALLTRAQIYLAQEDATLATADLETARSIAASMSGDAPIADIDLQSIVARIDLALENLPDRPDRALTDIQTAWEDLLSWINPGPDVPAETPTTEPAATTTPTPTPTP